MPKSSPLDVITQQLDDLSLDQLLEVRARVDALIKDKSSRKNESQQRSTQTQYFSVKSSIGSLTTNLKHISRFESEGICVIDWQQTLNHLTL